MTLLSTIFAYHGTGGGDGDGSPVALLVVVGLLATVGWVAFSKLSTRATAGIAAGAWAAGLMFLFAT